jgi:undecaprenyl-diphosphatase
VVATVPVGALGLVFEHQFRVLFAKPVAAALFLMANGVILLAGEQHRRRREARAGAVAVGDAPQATLDKRIVPMDDAAERELSRIGVASAAIIGASQALALLAGISREGVAIVGGVFRGLNNENAMRFSFLLSTPVIFAAGALKVPDLLGPLGDGIRPQVIAGSLAAVVTSLFAVVFLSRYFRTRTVLPFAIYSLGFGLASVIRFGLF